MPGFNNAMNIAHGVAYFLTLYREVYGPGATASYPGKKQSYLATHSETFQDILARVEIYTALNQGKVGNGSRFNIADGETVSWADVWPGLCSYFGLKGVGSDDNDEASSKKSALEELFNTHKATWDDKVVKKHGLKSGVVEQQNLGFVQFLLVDCDYDRVLPGRSSINRL